jgi:phage major head subunit gpT-like protein
MLIAMVYGSKFKRVFMIINQASLAAAFIGFKTAFNGGFRDAQPMWQDIATLVPSNTASENYGWLGQFPRLKEWLGDKAIGNMSAQTYSIINKDYESTIGVDRNNLEDDQYGFYSTLFQEMGFAAATHPDELVFSLLAQGHTNDLGTAYDGQNFFSVGHVVAGNAVANYTDSGSGSRWYLICNSRPLKPLIFQRRKDYQLLNMNKVDDEQVFMARQYRYGIEARVNVGFGFWQTAYCFRGALNAANYAAARQALLSMKSGEGRPLGITPELLIVPPSLEGSARDVVGVATIAGGGVNKWYNTAKIMVSPWLS